MLGRGKSVRKWGTLAALFALALQLVLSFDHFHPEDFFPPQALAGTPTADGAASHAPTKKSPLPPTHDDCAICVNMAMAAATSVPPPIVLAPPVEYVIAQIPIAAIVPLPLTAPPLPYSSRAPPTV